MKIEGGLFVGGTVFYLLTATVYWFWSGDVIGTTVLALTGGLAFLVAFYVLATSRRVYPRPEDRLDAEVEDADPEYGFYSPHSWWPLVTAFGAGLTVLGLIFAAWLVVLGASVVVLALVGWLFEYYRGDFAH
ncbi:MAG: cytochrome c oxidase subunit 4 [Candidatus Nanopelagicales bacterium]